jgi:chromate transporter
MMKKNYLKFLKDVLVCSLGAYGGPEAHFGVFSEQMVRKNKYLDEQELIELIAITTSLPGPSSTQTIIAIGYKYGGFLLALLTFLVWAVPAIIIMTLFAIFINISNTNQVSLEPFRYLSPMALAFVVIASYRIGKKVVIDKFTLIIFLFSALITMFYRNILVFVILIFIGGTLSIISTKETNLWNKIKVSPKYQYIILFALLLVFSIVATSIFDFSFITLFAKFYQFGSLVIGGGQVVVPYMYSDLVETNMLLKSNEFLLGYGLVQGIPGPMFSFSAFAAVLASRDYQISYQVLSSFSSALGMFLPGILIILFFYPIFEQLKKIKAIQLSIKGIIAVSGGFILSLAIMLIYRIESIEYLIFMVISGVLILSKKIPIPFIVLLMILIGYII